MADIVHKLSEELRKSRKEVAGLKRDVKFFQGRKDDAETIRKEIYGLAERTPEPPVWLTKSGKAGFRGCPMLMCSDWHYGEVVRRQEVGGVNTFNSKVAAERIKRLTHTVIALAYEHMGRAETVYPGIVVMLGGDMLSGDIHDELKDTNDRTPHQAVNDLTSLIAAMLGTFADKFGKVFVPCVVGNHGRGTMKPRMKSRIFTSFEWNIYVNLERHFLNDPRIQFSIPEETDVFFRVYNHRFLLTHGDSLGVRGGDGIIGSVGPIMRGAIKVGRSEAQIGRDFDTIIMGHWHQYLTLPGIIVNNSLKGYDEFARLALRAPYSRPSQALWFVHPQHGITAHWQVYLDEAKHLKGKTNWISLPNEKVKK